MLYTVQRGEDLRMIAHERGGRTSTEKLRAHPQNQTLLESRQDEVLLPGDEVFVPEPEIRQEPAGSGTTHRFRKKHTQRSLHLQLVGARDEALATTEYQISVDGGEWRDGVTNSSGELIEEISISAREARVRLPLPEEDSELDENPSENEEPLPADEAPPPARTQTEPSVAEPDDEEERAAGGESSDDQVDGQDPWEQNLGEASIANAWRSQSVGPGSEAPKLDVPLPAGEEEVPTGVEDEAAGDDRIELVFRVADLDPPDMPRGIQARLNNVGFAVGDLDGELGPRTEVAIAAFQRKYGLEVTREADDATITKLADVHRV